MARTIAIGDVHGCNKTLHALLQKLDFQETDTLVFLGDYIDRGPDSKGVIQTIMALQQLDYKVYTLRGNHELLFMDTIIDSDSQHIFKMNGGKETLRSFGVNRFDELNIAYQDFFTNTKFYLEIGEWYFVHAGFNFMIDNFLADEIAMLWERDFDDVQPKLGNHIMVHGHTPMPLEKILQQKGNCINIDGGCFYAAVNPAYGYLVARIMETGELVYVKNCE